MINKSALYLRKLENDAWLEKADSPCNFYLFPKCLTAHLFRMLLMMLSLQGCRNVWKFEGGDASCKLVGIIYPLSLVEMGLTDLQKFGGPCPPPPLRFPRALSWLFQREFLSPCIILFSWNRKYGLTVKEFQVDKVGNLESL